MIMDVEYETDLENEKEGLTLKKVGGYVALGLGLAAAVGGAIGVTAGPGDTAPAPGTGPHRPAFITEAQDVVKSRTIDMGEYQVTLPEDIPLVYGEDARVPSEAKEWTIMIYSASDNNLENDQLTDINDMEKLGSNDYMDIVVQVDRGYTADTPQGGDWTGARRYLIQKDTDPINYNSPILAELGQVDMAAPETLAEFVEFTVNNFPAKHYMLIIADHGSGWEGFIDDSSHHAGQMSTPELDQALEQVKERTGAQIDILGFDACLMGSTEVAYQVRDAAGFLVASEELEGVEGWPFEGIISQRALDVMEKFNQSFKDADRPALTPKLYSYLIVKEGANDTATFDTLSSTELEKMPKVASAVNGLAEALRASEVPVTEFNTVEGNSQDYGWGSPLVDVVDLAKNLAANEQYGKDVKLAANKVIEAVDQAIVAEHHNSSHPGSHGLHIYVPSSYWAGSYDGEAYEQMEFAEDTQWDEWLKDRVEKMKQTPSGQ